MSEASSQMMLTKLSVGGLRLKVQYFWNANGKIFNNSLLSCLRAVHIGQENFGDKLLLNYGNFSQETFSFLSSSDVFFIVRYKYSCVRLRWIKIF